MSKTWYKSPVDEIVFKRDCDEEHDRFRLKEYPGIVIYPDTIRNVVQGGGIHIFDETGDYPSVFAFVISKTLYLQWGTGFEVFDIQCAAKSYFEKLLGVKLEAYVSQHIKTIVEAYNEY